MNSELTYLLPAYTLQLAVLASYLSGVFVVERRYIWGSRIVEDEEILRYYAITDSDGVFCLLRPLRDPESHGRKQVHALLRQVKG